MEKSDEIERWQNVLNIHYGMSKEEAFERFREWRERKKTCQRCEGENLVEYCPIRSICMEADYVRDNAKGNDHGGRTFETFEPETFRASLFEARAKASVR
ncbi:MAG: hypothetical protein FJ110_04565 [Deltaproteobacteria bacterium]|nr:hypothetical protein [Deltaproteobacteria bacterium]